MTEKKLDKFLRHYNNNLMVHYEDMSGPTRRRFIQYARNSIEGRSTAWLNAGRAYEDTLRDMGISTEFKWTMMQLREMLKDGTHP